jgi:hypothetical protein
MVLRPKLICFIHGFILIEGVLVKGTEAGIVFLHNL